MRLRQLRKQPRHLPRREHYFFPNIAQRRQLHLVGRIQCDIAPILRCAENSPQTIPNRKNRARSNFPRERRQERLNVRRPDFRQWRLTQSRKQVPSDCPAIAVRCGSPQRRIDIRLETLQHKTLERNHHLRLVSALIDFGQPSRQSPQRLALSNFPD